MKPKSIGIIGGAGPMAGVCLTQRIFRLCMDEYGCAMDSDFPKLTLLSYPFVDMLGADINLDHVQKELKECLGNLRKQGAEVLAIACNTLHAFLDKSDCQSDLILLPQLIAKEAEKPLVLCTANAARYEVHKKFFPCLYPDRETQKEVDAVIERILRGEEATQELLKIIETQSTSTIILGCTELSLFAQGLTSVMKRIIDPLELLAQKIVEMSFKK